MKWKGEFQVFYTILFTLLYFRFSGGIESDDGEDNSEEVDDNSGNDAKVHDDDDDDDYDDDEGEDTYLN